MLPAISIVADSRHTGRYEMSNNIGEVAAGFEAGHGAIENLRPGPKQYRLQVV